MDVQRQLIGDPSIPGEPVPYSKITIILETQGEITTLEAPKIAFPTIFETDHHPQDSVDANRIQVSSRAMDVRIEFVVILDDGFDANFMKVTRTRK